MYSSDFVCLIGIFGTLILSKNSTSSSMSPTSETFGSSDEPKESTAASNAENLKEFNDTITPEDVENDNEVIFVKTKKTALHVEVEDGVDGKQLSSTTSTASFSSTNVKDRLRSRVNAFQYQNHSLRINVSELAACAGFHPYKSLPKVLYEHVYQGSVGQALLRQDAQLLGLQMVSDEQIWTELAQRAGKSTQIALKEALQVQTGQVKLKSIEAAEDLRRKVFHEAKSSKKLDPKQLATLEEGARHSIHTGFGTTWETQALDLYERQCGWEVTERNAEVRVWDFDGHGKQLGPAHTAEWRRSKHPRDATESPTELDVGVENKRHKPTNDDTAAMVETQASANTSMAPSLEIIDTKPVMLPFFSLRGSVDGIREEMVPIAKRSSEISMPSKEEEGNDEEDEFFDDDSWVLRRIVVECKHRMRKLQPSPPLYEMIQATIYCLMYETDEADLVQVLRKHQSRPNKQRRMGNNKTKDEGKENESGNNITKYFQKESESMKESEFSQNQEKQSSMEPMTSESTNETQDPCYATICKEKSTSNVAIDSESSLDFNIVSKQDATLSTKRFSTKLQESDDANLEIAVSRISIDDPVLQHQQNVKGIVLPRLQSWTEAVYSVRKDDSKRYQLLMALSSEDLKSAWNLLLQECPWLQHCDTSYQRDIANVESA